MTRRSGARARAAFVLPCLLAAACVASPQASLPAPASQPPAREPPVIAAAARAPLPVIEVEGVAAQGGSMVGVAPQGTISLSLDGRAIAIAPDRRFFIAFDRDAAPRARLSATLADGRKVERELSIAPGTWRIEHVNAPYRGSASTNADFLRRRPAELAAIAAARAQEVDAAGWRQAFRWPVSGRLSGLFGSQRVYQGKPGSYHGGTDVAVPAGTPFHAPADGVVTLAAAAPFTLEGHLLIIDHGMGLNSAFLHCQRLDVAVGDRVVQGQQLGTVGASGRATGPHLHWGVKWGEARLDPQKLAGPMRR